MAKADKIRRILEELYPTPKIPLKHENSFTLLLAVLLSAQCKDDRVNQVTPALFRLGISPLEISSLPIETVQDIIRPCGLSERKATAIVELSKILVRDFSSEVPSNLEQLQELPGVGRKTALVVLAQAFGIPAFPVDTHIHRLAHRWGLSTGKNVKQTEMDLMNLFPRKYWNKLHLQMIYYGREYCPARGHQLSRCRICQSLGNGS